jgi:hypothetical protein
MGSHAHLFTSNSEVPNYTLKEDDICLQGKYIIPVFWFLLFNSESYRYVMPIQQWEPDPEDTPDQFFIMEYEKALELYELRESKLFEVIPSEWKMLSTQFLEFLKSKPLKYIHLNVGELASMTEEKGFEEQVKSALDSLSQEPFVEPTGLFAKYRKPQLLDGWATLLGLSGTHQKKLNQLDYWNLAGCGEAEAAPWDE